MTLFRPALLASLALVAPARAEAPPGPKVERRAPACTAGGDPVFAIRVRPDDPKAETRTFTLFARGTYTIVLSRAKTEITRATGCAGAHVADAISARVAGRAWKTSETVACEALGAATTEYLVGDSVVYSTRRCDGRELDADSRAALAAVLALARPFDVDPAHAPPVPRPAPSR